MREFFSLNFSTQIFYLKFFNMPTLIYMNHRIRESRPSGPVIAARRSVVAVRGMRIVLGFIAMVAESAVLFLLRPAIATLRRTTFARGSS